MCYLVAGHDFDAQRFSLSPPPEYSMHTHFHSVKFPTTMQSFSKALYLPSGISLSQHSVAATRHTADHDDFDPQEWAELKPVMRQLS